jgi:hypothetical protein
MESGFQDGEVYEPNEYTEKFGDKYVHLNYLRWDA